MKQASSGDADAESLLTGPIQDPGESRTRTCAWAKKAVVLSTVVCAGLYLTCRGSNSRVGQVTVSERWSIVDEKETSGVLHFVEVGRDGYCKASHDGVNPNNKMCVVARGYMTADECVAICSGGTEGRHCGFTDKHVTACEWVQDWGCKLFRDEVSEDSVAKYKGHACWVRSSSTDIPTQPPGTRCDGTEEARGYLSGPVTVSLGDGQTGEFNLHVQILEKYDDGRSTCEIWQDGKRMWQEIYTDYINKGMPPAQTQKLLGGIIGGHVPEESGVYMESALSACGYAGDPRAIRCGFSVNDVFKRIAVHENFHGWQWLQYKKRPGLEDDYSKRMGLFFQFTDFANKVYKLRKTNEAEMDYYNYLDYSLQNEWEWGAEVFSQWMYNEAAPAWRFITEHAPEYKKYWECVWQTEKDASACRESELSGAMVQKPERHPLQSVPSVEGFTHSDQLAIWNVCLQTEHAHKYHDQFDELVRNCTGLYCTPNLPTPHRHYKLGFGDCNHDGYVDYLCWYAGWEGPSGVGGNGRYLWNKHNRHGAISFVVSGRSGHPWTVYQRDPWYETLKTLLQPMYREWQSDHGSCNGAFLSREYEGVKEMLVPPIHP